MKDVVRSKCFNMYVVFRIKDLLVILFEILVYFVFCWMLVIIINIKLRVMYKIGIFLILVSVLFCF